jgi:DNA replication protein DnaC
MVDIKSSKERIISYLKELHLPGIRESFESLAKEAEAESLSYEKYLLELLEREVEVRRYNRINRFLSQSRLPLEKNIESFDLKRLPTKVGRKISHLLEGHFVKQKENILAFGNPGSGKSHLLCAVGQELIRKGYKVLFYNCSLLVQELLKAKQELTLVKLLKKLSRYEVLIIDDIGYVQQNRDEMEVLFTLLAERYEKCSVMITSNLSFSQWDKIFKDPMTTAAAIDRLVHHSVILELNLPSYRMEKAKSKKKQQKNE